MAKKKKRGKKYKYKAIGGPVKSLITGETLTKRKPLCSKDVGKVSQKSISAFYKSWEWKKLAYKCKLRDGRRCACCGATPEHGAVIVSDHIKPLRKHWSLRLEPSNIQTMCSSCNMGKGSWDETDFSELNKEEAEVEDQYGIDDAFMKRNGLV